MRRGSPFKRSSPLARKSPLKPRKRMKRRRSRRVADRTPAEQAYLDFLHMRPCAVRGSASPCEGHITQSHARNLDGPTGTGRKESDFQSVPMCRKHHLDEWERGAGVFAGWSREARKRWMRAAIVVEHAEFRLGGGVIPEKRRATG